VELLPYLISRSVEENTASSYFQYFSKWQKWTEQLENVKAIPADSLYLTIYLINLLQIGKAYPGIRMSFYAVKYFNKFSENRKEDLFLAEKTLEGIKRVTQYTSESKSPIKSKHLKQIFILLGGMKINLFNLRTFLIMLLSFMGFLRFSEVVNIRRSDIIFKKGYLMIFLEKSKTDVYRKGHWIYITKLQTEICPLKLTRKYLKLAKIEENSNDFIFRGVSKTTQGWKLRKVDKAISYTSVRELILKNLKNIGLDSKKFGVHSLRSGGASAAANLGVEDRLFKKHGRWKSEKVKDNYVRESVKTKLKVSQNLGL